MKKIIIASLLAIAIVSIIVLVGCSASTPQKQEKITETKQSASSSEEIKTLKSDNLPTSWTGTWECDKSEANYFMPKETFVVSNDDNKVVYTDLTGGEPDICNRWFCFDASTSTINIFNEQPPFYERYVRETFIAKKESATEMTLSRKATGQEVHFIKK